MENRMKLDDIKITKCFQESIPREQKMKVCRDFWKENECQDRYLVVNRDGYLVDGYIMYLVLKENGCNEAVVEFSDRKIKRRARIKKPVNIECINSPTKMTYKNMLTTYVYGQHLKNDGTRSKEYVWRIQNGRNIEVSVGDIVLANTKFGRGVVEVTKVEQLEKCPVDYRVKKIFKKFVKKESKA